jgi:hypothetical protein
MYVATLSFCRQVGSCVLLPLAVCLLAADFDLLLSLAILMSSVAHAVLCQLCMSWA